MSKLDDLVFIYPADADDYSDDDSPRCVRFEEIFTRHHHGRTIEPTQQSPGRPSGTVVYHTGVNYLVSEFVDEVTASEWPDGTGLYVCGEHDDHPSVMVWPIDRLTRDEIETEAITVAGIMVFNAHPAASVEDVVKRFGFHPGQIVQSADGTQVYAVVDVLREAWFQATWHAYRTPSDQIWRWLAGDRDD